MERKPPLIIVTGPTGVGKTALSIALAKRLDGEIISADSMQVYRHMDIGSAKIRREEMQGVPHYMLDLLEPTESFDIVQFQTHAKRYIRDILERGRLPILVGGTGFYIQSVLYDVDFETETDGGEYRKYLETLAEREGDQALHDMLRKLDGASADAIHPHNRKRVVRALEYYRLTGRKISEHNQAQRKRESAYNACYFVLNDDRQRLYARIERRVDQMLEQGLLEEVRALYRMGCRRDMVSMQGLGYREILDYLEGRTTLERAGFLIKRNTRRFAKRQLTWFRRERDVRWIEKDAFGYDDGKIIDNMLRQIQEKGIGRFS